MAHCPVCRTEYIEETINSCINCGWDLSSYPAAFASQIPKAFLEKEQANLHWVTKVWTQLQLVERERTETQNQLNKLIVKAELQAQLQQLQEEREQLKTKLSKARSQLLQLDEKLENANSQVATLESSSNQTSTSQLQWDETQNKLQKTQQENLELQTKLAEIETLLNKFKQEKTKLQDQINMLSTERKNLHCQLQESNQEKDNFELEIVKTKNQIKISFLIGIAILCFAKVITNITRNNWHNASVNLRGSNITVKLRKEPKINQKNVLKELPDSSKVKIIKTVSGDAYKSSMDDWNNWYEVDINGERGYIASYYVDLDN